MVNNTSAGRMLGNTRGIAISSQVRDAMRIDVTPVDQKVYDYYAAAAQYTTQGDPEIPDYIDFLSMFKLAYQRVAFGQLTAAEGGAQVYDLVQRLTAK
jgi:multiple sugar transport system substrate-binding protein